MTLFDGIIGLTLLLAYNDLLGQKKDVVFAQFVH